jgi:hypothetical protein
MAILLAIACSVLILVNKWKQTDQFDQAATSLLPFAGTIDVDHIAEHVGSVVVVSGERPDQRPVAIPIHSKRRVFLNAPQATNARIPDNRTAKIERPTMRFEIPAPLTVEHHQLHMQLAKATADPVP